MGTAKDNHALGEAIAIVDRDSKLPAMYLPTEPHPLWTGKGKAYIYTTFVKVDPSAPEPIKVKTSDGKTTRPQGFLTLHPGDAVFYRDLSGSGRPEDDVLKCEVNSLLDITDGLYGPKQGTRTRKHPSIPPIRAYNMISELTGLDASRVEHALSVYARIRGGLQDTDDANSTGMPTRMYTIGSSFAIPTREQDNTENSVDKTDL